MLSKSSTQEATAARGCVAPAHYYIPICFIDGSSFGGGGRISFLELLSILHESDSFSFRWFRIDGSVLSIV